MERAARRLNRERQKILDADIPEYLDNALAAEEEDHPKMTDGQQGGQPAGPSSQPLQYTAPKPPKLIVDITECNIKNWANAVTRYARARRIVPAFKNEPANIDPDKYDLMKLELEGVIEESIPKSAFIAGLSDSVVELPPHASVAAVKAFCARQVTPTMKDQLRQAADEIKIERDESLDDYIQRHCEHRLGMARLNVPGSDEPSYVLTILRGLEDRPSLSSQVAWLQGMNFQTIFDLHMQLR